MQYMPHLFKCSTCAWKECIFDSIVGGYNVLYIYLLYEIAMFEGRNENSTFLEEYTLFKIDIVSIDSFSLREILNENSFFKIWHF